MEGIIRPSFIIIICLDLGVGSRTQFPTRNPIGNIETTLGNLCNSIPTCELYSFI